MSIEKAHPWNTSIFTLENPVKRSICA